MKKILITIFVFCSSHAMAQNIDIAPYFKGKSGCFILYDQTHNKLVMEYNAKRCAQEITPGSTFKVPLSVMAFDQKLITQDTVFKWDGKDRKWMPWNQDQTPKTWLSNSAVWVSQELTPKIGMVKIKEYLKEFNYGNQDFSGDPGKNNGLIHAWLSSSLKISGDEQLAFLQALVNNALPVSQEAMKDTKQNIYLETLPNGWKLYGKTGTGAPVDKPVNHKNAAQDGWFVGYIQKNDQTYIFVTNFTDIGSPTTSEAGGTRAKIITKQILQKVNL